MAENRRVGAVVGTLDATDRDAGDTRPFALINGDGFRLAGEHGVHVLMVYVNTAS